VTVASVISPAARQAADWLKRQLPAQARLSADSRTIAAGDVFVAYPGETSDGRTYISQAVAAGAGAIVVEQAGAEAFEPILAKSGTPSLQVEGLRRRAGELAAAYLDEPTARLTVVAVTGTNGKTSCTHWIAQGYSSRATARAGGGADAKAGVIGTLGAGVPGDLSAPTLTTPDAIGLQQQFAAFAGRGMELVAVEASSIGLQQGRLNGTRIAVAVLTNLTRDHLDYHVTMQAYAAAKARLFAWPTLEAMVVNLEDPASAEMLNAADPDLRRIGYLVNDGAAGRDPEDPLADAGERSTSCSDLLTITPIEGEGRFVLTHFRSRNGTTKRDPEADAGTKGAADEAADEAAGDAGEAGGADSVDLRLALIGRFNQSNVLAVAGVWLALGWTLAEMAAELEKLRPVPGRLQVIGDPANRHEPLAVVDYAHTPDAIANALQALRPLADRRGGRLWCVFGAGGNRDPGKRAPMGAAAQAHADTLVLTSDNPRNENPAAIIAQLRAGLSRAPHLVEPDRALAIATALRSADPADVVLIAGKGHETYQEIAGERHAFSDAEQARRALDARAAGSPGGTVADDADV
jgi:UDP-N-acetylmuramyl tripeptide synthase